MSWQPSLQGTASRLPPTNRSIPPNPRTLHGPFGGQRRHGVRSRDTSVEARAGLRGPVLGREVHVDDAEPLLVAVGPLEVVQQRPYEVPGQVRAVIDRAGGGVQVLVQVLDPL